MSVYTKLFKNPFFPSVKHTSHVLAPGRAEELLGRFVKDAKQV